MHFSDFRILLVYPNVMLQNTIPINIALLSACLKRAGFTNVRLFDTTFYRTQEVSGDEIRAKYLQLRKWDFSEVGIELEPSNVCDDFEAVVDEFAPHLIASTMVENTWQQMVRMLERVTDRCIPTVVGGVTATFAPEAVLAHDCVEMVCVGEGEKTLVELCMRIAEGRDHTSIPNLRVKTPNGVTINRARPLAALEDLPFLDFSIFEERRFWRPQRGEIVKMFPVETTRGCPYECTFCCASAWSRAYPNRFLRNKAVDRAMAEIRYQRDTHGMRYVYFSAETFLAMPERVFSEFLEQYSEISLPFWFQTRPETISWKRLEAMQNAGLDFRLSVGIESGNEGIRRGLLNRRLSNQTILEATSILNDLGVMYSVNNMIGFPDETRSDIFDTIELNRACKVRDVNCFIFVPYRGTALHKLCVQRGYIPPDHIAGEHTFRSTLRMPQITADELYGLFRTFPLYVKLPRQHWKEIAQAEAFTASGDNTHSRLAAILRAMDQEA